MMKVLGYGFAKWRKKKFTKQRHEQPWIFHFFVKSKNEEDGSFVQHMEMKANQEKEIQWDGQRSRKDHKHKNKLKIIQIYKEEKK